MVRGITTARTVVRAVVAFRHAEARVGLFGPPRAGSFFAVRTLLASALMLAACGRPDRADDPAAEAAEALLPRNTGPDAIVVRIPRAGGVARAYLYPRLDSAIWTAAAPAPAPARALGFDDQAGSFLYVDARGAPVRLSLRSGAATATRRPRLVDPRSGDGTAVYGLTDSGVVARLTPTGRWTLVPPGRPREVLPQGDGSLIVVGERGKDAVLWHLWPPETRIVDSARVAGMAGSRRLQAGDRVVLIGNSRVAAVRGRDLAPGREVDLEGTVAAAVSTPSGDRVYVALRGSGRLQVVPRDAADDIEEIELPGEVSELRMDPLGRHLLARPVKGDSALVIAVGSQTVRGAVATQWRADLPLVAPDGHLVLAAGSDARVVDGETLAPLRTLRGAGRDFWYVTSWNGFRPRDARLDEPVQFEGADSAAPGRDSVDPQGAFAGAAPDSSLPPTGGPQPPGAVEAAGAARGAVWYVSLASHSTEDAARAEAERTVAAGTSASVLRGNAGGRLVFRVVVGPYATRAEAEQAGAASGRSHWLFSSTP